MIVEEVDIHVQAVTLTHLLAALLPLTLTLSTPTQPRICTYSPLQMARQFVSGLQLAVLAYSTFLIVLNLSYDLPALLNIDKGALQRARLHYLELHDSLSFETLTTGLMGLFAFLSVYSWSRTGSVSSMCIIAAFVMSAASFSLVIEPAISQLAHISDRDEWKARAALEVLCATQVVILIFAVTSIWLIGRGMIEARARAQALWLKQQQQQQQRQQQQGDPALPPPPHQQSQQIGRAHV